MECLIEWRNCSFCYRDGENVLKDISIKIYDNEKVAIIGGNGAGKSTFFLGCIGVIRPQTGSILFRNQKMQYSKKEMNVLRQQVGLVFQDPDNQMIAPTVEGELSFGPLNRGMANGEVRQKVNQIIEEWELTHLRNRPPHFLSGGEKKRVSLCSILVMQPKLLLLDEPTSSLDHKNASLLKQQIHQLYDRGMSLMISTHDMDFVWEWAQRVIVFADGYVIADDSPEEIFQKDDVMERVGIQKPALYQAVETVCRLKKLQKPRPLLRTQKEFADWLSCVL